MRRGGPLVALDPEVCPACHARVDSQFAVERPLLRHGGYGAGRLTRWRQCPARRCGWFLIVEVKEVHPG